MIEAIRGTASTVPNKVEQMLHTEVHRALSCGWTTEMLAKVHPGMPDVTIWLRTEWTGPVT